jgi:CHAD domain-containing protein
MDRFIKKTIQLQDILGEIQDALTDIHIFSSMASKMRLKSTLRKDLGKILDQLIDFKQELFKEAHKTFLKKWKKFKTKKNLSVLRKVL